MDTQKKMEQYTIKKASEMTGISTTTIRRYIKAGRISASLQKGRFGPEYRISGESLKEAGFEQNGLVPVKRNGSNGSSIEDVRSVLKEFVPISLFQELAMKHEQLLVQYGMVRAGGQRLLEYKADNELKEQLLKEKHEQFEASLRKYCDEIAFLKKHLRLAELEIEDKNEKIRSLKDKVNLLELISRNAITTETIEKQFMEIYSKQEEIKRMINREKVEPEGSSGKAISEERELDH